MPSDARSKRLDLGSDDDHDSPPPQPRDPRPPSSNKPPSPAPAPPATAAAADDDDEDDYMNMIIEEPRHAETLSERQKRKQREAEIRGRPKSKAELALIEKEKREAALAKSLIDAEAERRNKGLKMMKMMGYKPGAGLGKQPQHAPAAPGENSSGGEGGGGGGAGADAKMWAASDTRLEPVGLAMKEDRAGIGHASEQKRKLEEAAEASGRNKRQQMDPEEFRERVRAEREEKRKESQFYAAQKVCEKLDAEKELGDAADADVEKELGRQRKVPLKSINILWRGLIRHREDVERERRMRHDMQEGISRPRMLGDDELHELDDEDKVALGLVPPSMLKKPLAVAAEVDGADEEDPELEEFEALSFAEKLDRIVEYLRTTHHYCFYCKYRYEDAAMEGCPGPDEDVHG